MESRPRKETAAAFVSKTEETNENALKDTNLS